jgi:YbgC/YbaW family acyl-CoA thioester hydrolase
MSSSVEGKGAVHEYEVLIREAHLDTFGHVNNATYLQLFEEARWDWITGGGYGLATIRETRQGPTILECSLQFRREVTNRQQLRIRSWVASYVGKVAEVHQELWRQPEDGAEPTLCCNAKFVMALFDLEARKLIPPTPAWLACLGYPSP